MNAALNANAITATKEYDKYHKPNNLSQNGDSSSKWVDGYPKADQSSSSVNDKYIGGEVYMIYLDVSYTMYLYIF